MHDALRVPDLLRDIVSQLSTSKQDDRRALGALATVNRDFSECAIDRLWMNITPWAFEHVMSKDPAMKVSHTWPANTSTTDCSRRIQRFDSVADITVNALLRSRVAFYSGRVHGLLFSLGSKSRYPTDVRVLSLLQEAHARLLPKVKEVAFDVSELDATAARCMQIAVAMTTPKVREIIFRIGSISDTASAHFNHQFFRTLRSRCTGLTHIVIRLPRDPDGHIQTAAKGLTRAFVEGSTNLRQVRLAREFELADHALLERLAGLHELRYLDVGAPRTMDLNTLSLKPGSFSKLDTLRLDDTDENAQLIHTILGHVNRLSDLKLRTYCKPGIPGPHPRLARDIGACTSLKRLRWRFSVPDDTPAPGQVPGVCWSTFQPLQSLAALEFLHISCLLPLQLSDAQILDLLSHWPRLRSWTHKNYADLDSHTDVSLRTLLSGLTRCPLVEELPLKLSDLNLPEESILAELEAMRHPFEHVFPMIKEGAEDPDDALVQTLQRVLPQASGRQSVYPAST
jgi:hypothetical protein